MMALLLLSLAIIVFSIFVPVVTFLMNDLSIEYLGIPYLGTVVVTISFGITIVGSFISLMKRR
ncbi:MAG: hypothetical protein NC251_10725 [Lachnoclostridium sp.]|nr:hypothetical protein [Lachnospira sp.]MCM1248893.1 hypothetical protein [Lachnoclostridium sp.]